jgi:hypothetical protein
MNLRICLLTITLLFGAVVADAQCTSDAQCVPQETINKCKVTADKLIASLDVIAKFQAERLTTDAEKAAAQTLIKALNDVIDIRGKLVADQDKIIAMYEKVTQLQADLIQKLTTALNKPRSAFEKFLTVLKEIGILAMGIAIGRL